MPSVPVVCAVSRARGASFKAGSFKAFATLATSPGSLPATSESSRGPLVSGGSFRVPVQNPRSLSTVQARPSLCPATSLSQTKGSRMVEGVDSTPSPPPSRHQTRYGAIKAHSTPKQGRKDEDDSDDLGKEAQRLFPSYRLLVALVVLLGQLCSFASQSIVGASLLTMVAVLPDVQETATYPNHHVRGFMHRHHHHGHYRHHHHHNNSKVMFSTTPYAKDDRSANREAAFVPSNESAARPVLGAILLRGYPHAFLRSIISDSLANGTLANASSPMVNASSGNASSQNVTDGFTPAWRNTTDVDDAPVDSEWYYAWGARTQTWILASFFTGYYIVQIPAGIITHKVGGRALAMWGSLVLAALQALCVYLPRMGSQYFIATIFLSGLANGCLYVPLMDILGKWVPPAESSTLVNLGVSGIGIGIAFVYGLSAFTSQLTLIGGWPFNFIALGGLLLLFAVLLRILVTDRPEQSTYISAAERRYIVESMEAHSPTRNKRAGKHSVPWKKIVTSGPVLAISASQFGTDWIQYFFITLFPFYLKHVRGLETETADMLAGLPWLGFPFFGFICSSLVDRVRKTGVVSISTLRKIADGCSKIIPMCLLTGVMYMPQGHNLLLGALYILSIVFVSLEGSSWVANIVDVSTHYAGFVSSVAQVLSLPGSILLPLLVQVMTPHNSLEEWQHCILVMFAIVGASYVVYCILGSSEPQDFEPKTSSLRRRLLSTTSPSDPPTDDEDDSFDNSFKR